MLKDQAGLPAGLEHRAAAHGNAAGGGLAQAGQQVEQRRLAAARRADDGPRVAALHRPVKAAENGRGSL